MIETLLSDPISNQLFVGGILGGFIRAFFGRGKTWERILVLHILSGAATAVLLPNAFVYLTGTAIKGSPLFWVSAGMLTGLFGNFILVALLWRAGVFKEDPRPTTIDNGGGAG